MKKPKLIPNVHPGEILMEFDRHEAKRVRAEVKPLALAS